MDILFSKIYISWLNFFKVIKNMATQFPKFNQALIQDPSTRRIWYGIATSHDLENHDEMTEDNLYNKIFTSHFGHLAIFFM